MIHIQQERHFIPFGMSKVDELGGQPIYSSNSIKSMFLEVVAEMPKLKPIHAEITQLVNEGIIIPGYVSSGLFGFLVRKAFSNKFGPMMGCYVPDKNKIYILVESFSSYTFFVPDQGIADVILHELCHYAVRNQGIKFVLPFKKQMIEYYQLFFRVDAAIVVSPVNVWRLITFLHKTFEINKPKNSDLDKMEKFYYKYISDDKESVNAVLYPVFLYLMDPDRFFSKARTNILINKCMITLIDCYSDVFKIHRPNTAAIQELIFPSEIICISSQKPDKRHYKVI